MVSGPSSPDTGRTRTASARRPRGASSTARPREAQWQDFLSSSFPWGFSSDNNRTAPVRTSLFCAGRREPAGQFHFAPHLGRIGGINVERDAFENDKRFRLLDVVEKMEQRRPWALYF